MIILDRLIQLNQDLNIFRKNVLYVSTVFIMK